MDIPKSSPAGIIRQDPHLDPAGSKAAAGQPRSKAAPVKKFILAHEDKIILILGFILVSFISFGIGRISLKYRPDHAPVITVEDRANCAPNADTIAENSGAVKGSEEKQNAGKVIGNKKSMVYHLPGGRFYDTISAENRAYFDTEADAIKAGYRKSKL